MQADMLLGAAQRAKLSANVQESSREHHVEAAAIAIVKSGKTIYEQSFGLRDVAAGIPSDVETKFEVGSLTDEFTAAAIFQLKESGKVNLDAPLVAYLPTLPHTLANVTIRQLLTDTSGLPSYTSQPNFAILARSPTTLAAIVAQIADKPLDFTPGTQFGHSNTNYVILGSVIEAVSGEPWERYAQEHLFGPAGMSETSTIQFEGRLSDMARGYAYANGKMSPSTRLDESWASSAGDVVTTIGDLAKWHEALASGRIIAAADYRELTATPRLADGTSSSFGNGEYVTTFKGQPAVLAQGDTFGFDATDLFFPSNDVRIIVLTNSETEGSSSIDIAESVYSELFPGFSGTQAAASAPTAETFYARALQTMTHLQQPAYATYDVSIGSSGPNLSLIDFDDGPFLKLGGKGQTHLESKASFRSRDGRVAVRLDDGSYASTYYGGLFGATWSSVHDWMRYGGDSAAQTAPTERSENATTLRTIAIVSALSPGDYRIIDRGAAACPGGTPGHAVHLIALADTERHPLTDATVDLGTGEFCLMRFTITSHHLRCLHLCTATTELHFGDVGGYSVVSDARLVVTWRVAGIDAGHLAEQFHYSNFAFPISIDSALFANSTFPTK